MPRATRRKTLKTDSEKVVYESKSKYKQLKPLNKEQYDFIRCIREHTVSLGMGIAGTGKNFIACGVAAEMLNSGEVEKIVLVRSNIGAGPTLGLLPGEVSDKLAPYTVPMLTELGYFLDTKALIAQGKIVAQPIEFARGLTFLNSVVLIDEAQNIDQKSLKLLLSRIGAGSKYIIIGDTDQSDLKPSEAAKTAEKLEQLMNLSKRCPEIGYTYLYESVRHPLITTLLSIW